MQNSQQNSLIRAIIERKLREDMQKQKLQNSSNPLDRINGISSKVGNIGQGLSDTGSFLNNNFSSMNKIGTGMQNVGNALQNGASAVQKAIPTSSALMNNIGTKIGSAIGSGATTGAAASAGTTAGAGVAGGAAAGGSATSGAMAGGPIGALVALGAMALQGTNRKRAKQTGQQAQQISEALVDDSQNRLNQTNQIAEMIGNQNEVLPDYSIQQPTQDDYLTQFGGDTQSLIDSYIQSAMPEHNPITNSIDSYVNNPNSTEELKRGVFDKLANGLSDFMTGYKDNRENSFDPDNLRPEENKWFMQRMGEGFGTIARVIQNPVAQGLVAGGLSTALTGNPLYGLGMANKFANNKMNSDLYKNILKNQGANIGSSNGVITSDDMSKILTANKYQKGYMTRKEYDRMRLENGLISVDEYNQGMSAPDYNPDEMVNITGLEAVSKAGRNAQQNKNDKSANYYRTKNEGKNVVKVEYGEKPDSHNYTHVTYGSKPEQKSTTTINYNNKPQTSKPTNNKGDSKKDNSPRVKVKSPDGKVGSIPATQLIEAIKKGFKKI